MNFLYLSSEFFKSTVFEKGPSFQHQLKLQENPPTMNVCFYFSSDVQYNVHVRISGIFGLPSIEELANFENYSPTTTKNGEYECFIESSLYQKGMILGLPITCSYKQFSSSSCFWNEWIKFPVRICDISRDTQIVFTIYSVSTHPIHGSVKHIIGGVTIPLFEQRILRYGRYKLRICQGLQGDGSIDSQTLFTKLNRHLTIRDQLQSKITEKAMKQIPKVPYLDALTNRRLSKIYSKNNNTTKQLQISPSHHGMYLEIDLPNFGYKVVYQEKTVGKKSQLARARMRGTYYPQKFLCLYFRKLYCLPFVHDTMYKIHNKI